MIHTLLLRVRPPILQSSTIVNHSPPYLSTDNYLKSTHTPYIISRASHSHTIIDNPLSFLNSNTVNNRLSNHFKLSHITTDISSHLTFTQLIPPHPPLYSHKISSHTNRLVYSYLSSSHISIKIQSSFPNPTYKITVNFFRNLMVHIVYPLKIGSHKRICNKLIYNHR